MDSSVEDAEEVVTIESELSTTSSEKEISRTNSGTNEIGIELRNVESPTEKQGSKGRMRTAEKQCLKGSNIFRF